jgi:hypothetical protein
MAVRICQHVLKIAIDKMLRAIFIEALAGDLEIKD